ncbi:hypothetical protein QAD02_017024 [Eretmocerus hayati]|uniref:Uncharacterized protein n=1 Tax=Eretmocerus hayati TaxID=131215 RepID=A0ACC2PFL1_9HYME|nr:hypothetical protein QAD02_017024 [Eretmocerus hayati]
MKFLEQVKECQHHLYCMEKLFFSIQNVSENSQAVEKESNLNKDESTDNCKNNSSNTNVLIEENGEKLMLKKNRQQDQVTKPHEKLIVDIQVRTENYEEMFDPVTFLIQVPSNILDSLKSDIERRNKSSSSSIRKMLKLRKKKKIFSMLQKIFGIQKRVVRTSENIQNNEESQIPNQVETVREKEQSSSMYESNLDYLNSDLHGKNQGDCGIQQREEYPVKVPITYKFDKVIKESSHTVPHSRGAGDYFFVK